MAEPIVIQHPLIQDKFSHMRDKHTDSATFRRLLSEISELICYEATRDLKTFDKELETPMSVKLKCPTIKSKSIVFVSIMRAGNGMLDGVLKLIPSAQVGHIGLYRDPKSFSVIEYYFKMPLNMEDKHVIIVDPMIATGNSAVAAVARIKETKPKSIIFISLVASPEGMDYFQSVHPDIKIYTAKIDSGLDARNYIIPGLGDAGDRMFGTS